MATTTLAQAQHGAQVYPFRKSFTAAEAAGVLQSSWNIGGTPGTGATPSTGSGSTCTGATAGSYIPDKTGDLVLLSIDGTTEGSSLTTYIFCDRLWHASGLVVTTTTAQTINSVAFPSRCLDGTANGLGVMFGIEVQAATTNAGAITNMTASYTNEAGTAGRTATIASFPATCVVNSFIPFQLQEGDSGVRSIESVTLGTSLVTGTVYVVAYIPVFVQGIYSVGRPQKFSLDRALTRLRPSSCIFCLEHRNSTTAQAAFGSLTLVNG